MNGLVHILGSTCLYSMTRLYWTFHAFLKLLLEMSRVIHNSRIFYKLAPCPFDKQQITFADIQVKNEFVYFTMTYRETLNNGSSFTHISHVIPLCSYAGHTLVCSLPWQHSLASFLVTACLVFNLAYKIIIKLIYNFWSTGHESYYFSDSSICTGQKAKEKFLIVFCRWQHFELTDYIRHIWSEL